VARILYARVAVVTAVLAGSLAGPSVLEASPAPSNETGPAGVLNQVTSEVLFDVSPGNITAILGDLPGFPPYTNPAN
jgi:hypothetical protein